MQQYLSAHIETNNTDYGHASTNHVRLPGLEGWEIDSRLPGPDTLRRMFADSKKIWPELENLMTKNSYG